MAGVRSLQLTLAAVLAALAGLASCSPEVVIAHVTPVGGGSAGVGGAGGIDTGGTGDVTAVAGQGNGRRRARGARTAKAAR